MNLSLFQMGEVQCKKTQSLFHRLIAVSYFSCSGTSGIDNFVEELNACLCHILAAPRSDPPMPLVCPTNDHQMS